ncbi:hypothetical protein P280DRAFT_458234 [Massarina eburnea CBS 473.64]|uniref:HAUS augmin-like complex subunit 3 N-terminal domain-containing protein n=1 Tax=Massarina eburnea CBS 473.64 TaxID=1395130 RepID=A0A6A6RSL2_9PLEO|nr:hypothetical protein P280DRAFT_458234 [Massarina eburnea CBS 473.64]
MAEEQAAHHLLNVLEERGLDSNLDLDHVLAAFEDENTKRGAAEWVNEYLGEETLLTREELELYHMLRRKGILHQYEAEEEPIRPILDHELATAIDSLQSSTAAIEAQCKVLEAQKAALMQLKALDKPNLDVEHLKNERRRKETQEKARLDIAFNDIATIVTEQLTDAQRDIDVEKSTLKRYLTERLASDDQILSRLPGIVSQVAVEPEVSDDEKSIEQWCKAIISYRAAEVKARVDTVYLDSLTNHSPEDLPTGSEDELREQKAALQAELEDLYSEIASVVEMVVEHEMRKPMMDMKERKEREGTRARAAWLNYVLTTLEYMGKRLHTVTEYTDGVDQFQQAVVHVGDAAAERIPDAHAEAVTPMRSRALSTPKSSLFTPAFTLKPPKSMDLPAALQDALRHANMSDSHDSIETLTAALSRAQFERSTRLREHYDSSSASTHGTLAARTSRADGDLRTILRKLYSHTAFQQVQLTDAKIEEEVRRMGRELDMANDELLTAETNELSMDDARVRAFVSKYGK